LYTYLEIIGKTKKKNMSILQVGKEGAPFQHQATITMHGVFRSAELPIYGSKSLGVREGTLDLHGQSPPTPRYSKKL
jgi:hypothetical protein